MNTNSNKSRLIGFILSLILTIIPFYITKHEFSNKNISLIIIQCCAIIQIYIHLIYFLHFKNIPNQIWNTISLYFTIFIALILVIGSIWIMTHLHHNLML